ncbi:phosphate ABC transporter permease subunit PstC [Opitutus terrae]|uniref:Phosphate transport system permease protein n=1 Tax=Opitutus terrae (strain DSM 11246 / JCM 15787 / PB90-1) TaxID=452637 RepID=B1ZT39_OPITP|nr:phosphate ABC transporter permease subunit PstC [Opitutus terrae]ACB75828.1 phosphate ABC transporter, inner membrane subunit PstC [Opitutus terrae PB90-1]
MPPASSTAATPARFAIERRRIRFLGLSLDDAIRVFFGGNAFVAVVVLTLITVFLAREGGGFFGQNLENLRIYRQAGLEYVDYIRRAESEHTALTRALARLRQDALVHELQVEKLPIAEANARLTDYDAFAGGFSDAIEPLRGFVSDLGEQASAIKTKFTVSQDQREHRAQLLAEGRTEEAAAVKIDEVDFGAEVQVLTGTLPLYRETSAEVQRQLAAAIATLPAMPTAELRGELADFQRAARTYIAGLPQVEQELAQWDWQAPVPRWQAFTRFLFGREWLTASFWQDRFGVLPLLTGSLLVSGIALALAVPLGVGAAIYVNQLASTSEQRLIKPGIEFISAFPSVVLGFFGIVFLGEHLRTLSQLPWLSWVPGFPIAERLNALTAGCLLGLIAVPTIFTLAEDALNNVPRSFREASLALGATRLQTIVRITVPAALSGIVSAVLLGFGRVIGETMVVLLCAGNRIAIPDFSEGLGVITQPVHTMTGIIAQEMGEVVRGSMHYRALFVVGLLLFVLSLAINYAAQKIVRRYRINAG